MAHKWSTLIEGPDGYTLDGRAVRPGDFLELGLQAELAVRVTFDNDPDAGGVFFKTWAGLSMWSDGVCLHIRARADELAAVPVRWPVGG